MSAKSDKTIRDIARAIKKGTKEKTKGYDTPATVTRIEGSIAWVHIPGGVDETPVKMTISAQVGDVVQARVVGGRAFLVGNRSNPPTDDSMAREAVNYAQVAGAAANSALESASTAREAAEDAVYTANSVRGLAEQAQEDAGIAKDAAEGAVKGLAQVEDVVGVLNWMRAHGDYTTATEHEADPNTYYFTVAIVADPAGNPREREYYELNNGIYTMTLDTSVDSEKTYYTLSQVSPVPEGADPAQLGYVKMTNLQEVVADYVNMHLALLDDGLYVLADENGWRVKITNQGIFILDENGDVVTTFSESIIFSSTRSQYIGSENAFIEFDHERNRILISGKDVYMIAPLDAFTWDTFFDVVERERMNEGLDLSEDTSSWIVDDITTAEMLSFNNRLDTDDPTDEWIYDDVTVDEYKGLCNKLGISYQFGKSVYVGLDAISLGEGFFVDDDGYLISTSGRIGGWDIGEDRLTHALPTSPDYMSISGADGLEIGQKGTSNYMKFSAGTGMKFGDYFSVTPDGVITARRGEFAGFTMVPQVNGRDYMVSDYSAGGVDYRTWIRGATQADAGDTWAFSTQVKKTGTDQYHGGFIATASGELWANPYKANGDSGDAQFSVRANGIFLYPGVTVSNQPNLYWNTSTHSLAYTTWSSSSEQIKKRIREIKNQEILPENLYNVEIIQFQYKDQYIDKDDTRYDKDLIGFLIEDLDKHYPIAVDKADPEDPKTWAWNSAYLIPAMMKLIQDQKKEIDNLKSDIAEIKAMLKGESNETMDGA